MESEEEIEAWETDIGMRRDPDQDAREALRRHQEAAGIVVEDPDRIIPPDAKAQAMADDEELGPWMGGKRRG